MYLDKQVVKHTFKQLLGMEPRIINASDAAKEVLEFLELEIAKCEEKTRLLRLLCLYSLTQNGIAKEQYALLTKEFIDAFGIAELLRILNLERAGILKRRESGGVSWSNIRDVPISVPDHARCSLSLSQKLTLRRQMTFPMLTMDMLQSPSDSWNGYAELAGASQKVLKRNQGCSRQAPWAEDRARRRKSPTA